MYYQIFYYLESCDLLDPLIPLHMYALHYTYLPRINKALHSFRETWNDHGLRTEHGLTPNQLFTVGALRLRNTGSSTLDFFDEVPESYGIDEDVSLHSQESDQEGVVVPPNEFSLTDEQLTELQRSVDPLSHTEDMGIDLYLQAVECIFSMIS